MAYSIDLSGRVAFVTGASSGLGAQFARVLATAGAAVVLASRRVDKLKDLRAEIEGQGGDAHVLELDVTDHASIKAAVAHAETEVGSIDILVNNSGVSATQRLQDVAPTDYDALFDTNVKGAFFVAQEVGKRMLARAKGAAPGTYTGGRIVNIASMAGLRVLPQIGVYCMTKAAGASLGSMSMRCARAISTPRSITTIGKPKQGRNWCKCCRANALASPKIWMPFC
jgi:NAD(P)-dependent dehydrogenase (short-subunit alcohol dehydrogenase family)